MSTITLQGYIIVPDSDIELVKQELPNHIKRTKNEKGCLLFEVTQDLNHINRFSVYEQFVDQASFAFHQKRVANSAWGKVTVNVERHYEITEE
ncbi:MAG: antibiotic biosynthesis monooxygenase [Pseudomonadales bacterium]|nr:antibiotic biosynthesis monooxygenase [Pseudomonadales bacterium]